MTQSFWQDFKIANTTTQLKQYDFLIIGAGIAGLSTAYWLLREDPKLKIGIVEKFKIGFGASGRNAGFVTCGSTEHFIKLKDQFGLEKAVEIWKFSEDNRKLLMVVYSGRRFGALGLLSKYRTNHAPTEH
jgi:gamma-glutamylputrescine oxidase